MPANNIIVLDLYYNLTNKSNVIDRLFYTMYCLFGSGLLFLGHPVCNSSSTILRTLYNMFLVSASFSVISVEFDMTLDMSHAAISIYLDLVSF